MTARRRLSGLLILAATGMAGCSESPITAARLEAAVAPTFANLVQLQVASMGLPPLAARDVSATAACRRPSSGSESGSGEWTCTLVWHGPDRQTLTDSFDVFVTTEGCYTATAGTESLGGPTLRTSTGSEVRNLLYAFEGCFDTT